jgi:hypothetical protein
VYKANVSLPPFALTITQDEYNAYITWQEEMDNKDEDGYQDSKVQCSSGFFRTI